MEDNKILVLAILILIISSFNVSSITGKATVSESTGSSSAFEVSQTSIVWLLRDGKGDMDGDGIAFTPKDFQDFTLKYARYQNLKNYERGYYNPKEVDSSSFYSGDVFPAPNFDGDTAGDGSWSTRDLELFRQLVRKSSAKSSNSVNIGPSSLISECRPAQVSIAPRGYRRCNEFGEWEEFACPDGYSAILGSPINGMQRVVCAIDYVKEGEGLGIVRVQ